MRVMMLGIMTVASIIANSGIAPAPVETRKAVGDQRGAENFAEHRQQRDKQSVADDAPEGHAGRNRGKPRPDFDVVLREPPGWGSGRQW